MQFSLKCLMLATAGVAGLVFVAILLRVEGPSAVAYWVLVGQTVSAYVAQRYSAAVQGAGWRRFLRVLVWSLMGSTLLGGGMLVFCLTHLRLYPPTRDPFGGAILMMALATISAWAIGFIIGGIIGLVRTKR